MSHERPAAPALAQNCRDGATTIRDPTHGLLARRVTHAACHAVIAHQGIALALSELVEEGWLSLSDALDLIDPIMHNNARQIFNLAEKTRVLQNVKWT